MTSPVQPAKPRTPGDAQHFVPRLLLKRFAAQDLVRFGSMLVHVVETRPPEHPSQRRRYHRSIKSIAKLPAPDPGHIEGVHYQFENSVSDVVDAIAGGATFPLSRDQAEVFFGFFAHQFTRTPRGRDEAAVASRMKIARKVLSDPKIKEVVGRIGLEAAKPRLARLASHLQRQIPASPATGFNHTPRLYERLVAAMWKPIVTAEDTYITSDHPCVLMEPGKPSGGGPHYFLALSPRCLVLGCGDDTCEDVVHIGYPPFINRMMVLRAHRQVYCSNRMLADEALAYAQEVEERAGRRSKPQPA